MNVWILCNEDAGRGVSANDLGHLVDAAGHTVLGVAKQYDEGMPLPDGRLDLVVAAAGDGTVATVAGVASKTSAALAILPLGTANNIATSLGLHVSVPDLIASWAAARRVPLDLGCARAASKKWLIVEGAGGRQRARVDGRKISDTFLLVEVLNIRSIGPNLVFAPDANSSDGYFDVIMADESHRDRLLSYLEQRAEGRDARLSLPRCRAREVMIESCAELHIDDERVDTCGLGQISVRIEPAAITVLV